VGLAESPVVVEKDGLLLLDAYLLPQDAHQILHF
jgi:hypothetical protein